MRRKRQQQERWGQPHLYRTPEGALVESVVEYVGYGFTHYTISGTPEAIEAEGRRILRRYPSDPYSTTIYWPPEKWQHHNTPVEDPPGHWIAKACHSNSSD